MNKSITQATQNNKQISKSIKRFFARFHVSSALRASNAYKKTATPHFSVLQTENSPRVIYLKASDTMY